MIFFGLIRWESFSPGHTCDMPCWQKSTWIRCTCLFALHRRPIANWVTGRTCSPPPANGRASTQASHYQSSFHQPVLRSATNTRPTQIQIQAQTQIQMQTMVGHQPKHHTINPVSTSLCWVVQKHKPTNTEHGTSTTANTMRTSRAMETETQK